MRLCVFQNLGNNKTRLEYISSKSTPYNTPGYVINSDCADEFVSKYNKTSDNLTKLTAGLTVTGALYGWLSCAKKASVTALKRGVIAGMSGFLFSSFVSYGIKDRIMNKYNVDKYR